MSLAAAFFLMRSVVLAGGGPRVALACGVYSAALVTLYLASALSHSFHDIKLRALFRTFDQACIFLMIAGSFTPFAVVFLNHGRWWMLLAAIWALAFAGVSFALRRREMSRRDKFAYAALGLTAALSFREIYNAAPLNVSILLLAGCLCYLFGSVFLGLGKKTKYCHALWHIFVLAGSACHYICIAAYIAAP
ncbi:MAG: hemolysin III family protein [Elusimicrobia bacterium CG_4_10_14_0_2_um_filter_56_8]|nr:MAG: hemolysin III family protein [Elusimicrobia bacterium CG_4_10_14_0_2_um_filter_56_8]